MSINEYFKKLWKQNPAANDIRGFDNYADALKMARGVDGARILHKVKEFGLYIVII